MNVSKKKLPYTAKYVILACCFLLTVNFILGIVLSSQSKQAMKILIQEHMLDTANTAAATLDGDLLATITAKDVDSGSENFHAVIDKLSLFRDHMHIKYIYVVKQLSGKNFVFIIDSDPIDPGKFGEPVVYTEALYSASQGTASVDKTPFSDRWGRFYSAYSPVLDSNGNISGIVGVDYDAEWFEEQLAINTASILVISVFSLIVGSAIIIFCTNRFRKKIKHLNGELTELTNEVECLNKEMTSNADLQHSSAVTLPLNTDENAVSSSFEALGDNIRKAKQNVKQYVSYVREQDYTDALTGVGNKSAYWELVREIDYAIKDESASFSVALFDVNNIREVNNQHGLKYGDQMIVDTATLLLKAFDPKSIFRIGSDEFIVLANECSKQDITNSLTLLDNYLEAFNMKDRPYETILSFTSGTATYEAGQDHQYNDVFKRAAETLSQHKALYYQQAGDRRRN